MNAKKPMMSKIAKCLNKDRIISVVKPYQSVKQKEKW